MTILKGIQVKEFAHSEDTAATEALRKAGVIKKILDGFTDKGNRMILKSDVLGNYIGITEKDMPKLYGLLHDVCQTLDYSPFPRIFIYHSPSFEISIYAGETPLLIIPDFIVDDFDDDMLRFSIGRAVTALKSDACQIRMLAGAMLTGMNIAAIPGLKELASPIIADWFRKAGLTEDRGGLLACQNEEAALRVLMRMAGMPMRYLHSGITVDYLRAYQNHPLLSKMSQYINTINRIEHWNNHRIACLHQWYTSGQYDDLIEEYE